MKPPAIAIVVDTDVSELRITESALQTAGFAVITVNSFQEAKTLLQSVSPGIVVAAIKLGPYNGLHLAALCEVAHPEASFIVTDSVYDPVLAAEATRAGAVFVVATRTREELTRLSLKLVGSPERSPLMPRQWPRKPVPGSISATVATSEARLLDVSYAGVRFRLGAAGPKQEQPAATFDVNLPQLALSLRASRVWATPDPNFPGWVCGADLTQNGPGELGRWRDFVDSLH
jgi:hypothetical protein